MITKKINKIVEITLVNDFILLDIHKVLTRYHKKYHKSLQERIINQYGIVGWPLVRNYTNKNFYSLVYTYLTQSPSKDFRKPVDRFRGTINNTWEPSDNIEDLAYFVEKNWTGKMYGKLPKRLLK